MKNFLLSLARSFSPSPSHSYTKIPHLKKESKNIILFLTWRKNHESLEEEKKDC